MAEDIPKLDLLIKMMKMTTANGGKEEDNVALVALRKANALLHENGWDWEKILRGKVKIVEDPFKSVDVPRKTAGAPPPPPSAFRPVNVAPQPQPRPQPFTTQPPRPAYSPNYNKPHSPKRHVKRKPSTQDILDNF